MKPTDLLHQQVRQMLRQLTGVVALSNGTEVITADVPFKIIHGPDSSAFIIRIRRCELPRGVNYAQFRREQRLLERSLGKPVGLYIEDDSIVITNPETEHALDAIRGFVSLPTG